MGASAADSGLGADHVQTPLAPAPKSIPSPQSWTRKPHARESRGSRCLAPAPPVLAGWESGWHHALLISKSSLVRYLLGGRLGKRRQLGRNGGTGSFTHWAAAAQVHRPSRSLVYVLGPPLARMAGGRGGAVLPSQRQHGTLIRFP